MVMGVLNEAFDVLVLKFGVQKRIYCNVSFQHCQCTCCLSTLNTGCPSATWRGLGAQSSPTLPTARCG